MRVRRPPQPGAGARRGRGRVRRDGPEGAGRGGRRAGPASASARCAATSRPSRRSSRPCSRRCTSRCSSDARRALRAARSRAPRSSTFFVALPGVPGPPPRARRADGERDRPARRRRSRCATRCASAIAELVDRARRPRARSAPTSGPADVSMLFSGVAHATALAGDLQPVLRERYVAHHPRRAAPARSEPRCPGRPLDFAQLRRHEAAPRSDADDADGRRRRRGLDPAALDHARHRRSSRRSSSCSTTPCSTSRSRRSCATSTPRCRALEWVVTGLRAHVRDAAHHRRPARRHLRPPAHLHHRRRALRRRVAARVGLALGRQTDPRRGDHRRHRRVADAAGDARDPLDARSRAASGRPRSRRGARPRASRPRSARSSAASSPTNYSWRWSFRINVIIAPLAIIGALLFMQRGERATRRRQDRRARRGADRGRHVLARVRAQRGRHLRLVHADQGLHRRRARRVAGDAPDLDHPDRLRRRGRRRSSRSTSSSGRRSGATAHPLFEFAYLRFKTYRYGLLTGLVLAMGQLGLSFVLPVFLQDGRHLSPWHNGLWLLPTGVFIIVGAQLGGRLIRRFGTIQVVRTGLVIYEIGLLLMLRAVSLAHHRARAAPRARVLRHRHRLRGRAAHQRRAVRDPARGLGRGERREHDGAPGRQRARRRGDRHRAHRADRQPRGAGTSRRRRCRPR